MAAKPPGPAQRGREPLAELNAKLKKATTAVRQLLDLLAEIVRFSPVFIYFFLYWRPKEFLRTWLRVGALGFLSLSLVMLWLDVAAEITQLRFLRFLVPTSQSFRWLVLALFTCSVLSLLWHHHQERKQRYAEFLLAERVCEFMMNRGSLTRDECLTTALRLFHEVFKRFGIKHTSVALPVEEKLCIDFGHVYPSETDASFFDPLSADESVAGLVFTDFQPRYVPRLFFPWNDRKRRPLCVFFPHAMIFEIRKGDLGRVDVVRPKIDLDAFKTTDVGEFAFVSFVTVPLKPLNRKDSIGVLNFDFKRTDPLSRIDVKMAVLLGMILADELERLARLPSQK